MMPAISTSAHCTITRLSNERAASGFVSLNCAMHCIPGERIDFEVDAIARPPRAERGAPQGFRDERDFEPALTRRCDRHADAVDADERLLADVTREIRRQRDAHALALPFGRARKYFGGGVDMTVHE